MQNTYTSPQNLPTLRLPANHAAMNVFHAMVRSNHSHHDHSFLEIVLVTEGRGVHVCPSGRHRLQPGDVVVLRPGTWHAYVDCEELGVFNCCLSMQFLLRDLTFVSKQTAFNDLFWTGPLSDGNHGVLRLHLDSEQQVACAAHLDALAASNIRQDDPCALPESIGHLLLALSIIARAMTPVEGASLAATTHPAVMECRRLIEERCDHDWSLPELAERVHIVPSYLSRLFKRDTGVTPIVFLSRCRAERAAQLLLQTDLSITQIGVEVGWSDASYFARCFKKSFGVSASEYRERFAGKKG